MTQAPGVSNENPKTEGTKTATQLNKEEQLRQLDELKKKADDTMKMLQDALAKATAKYPTNATARGASNETTQRALAGDITMECPSSAKIVRIFTSSTFTGRLNREYQVSVF